MTMVSSSGEDIDRVNSNTMNVDNASIDDLCEFDISVVNNTDLSSDRVARYSSNSVRPSNQRPNRCHGLRGSGELKLPYLVRSQLTSLQENSLAKMEVLAKLWAMNQDQLRKYQAGQLAARSEALTTDKIYHKQGGSGIDEQAQTTVQRPNIKSNTVSSRSSDDSSMKAAPPRPSLHSEIEPKVVQTAQGLKCYHCGYDELYVEETRDILICYNCEAGQDY